MSGDNDNNNKLNDDIIDGPLIIVPDEDDYNDEYERFDITTATTTTSVTQQQSTSLSKDSLNVEVKNLMDSLAVESNTKSKLFYSNEPEKSNKVIHHTVVIDTSFKNQRTRTKTVSKRKNSNNKTNHNEDSILSFISFDNISNIITISRMGSIYYCIEDLYLKVFSSLCVLDEFTDLLIKSGLVMFKQVTLSEKLSIEQQRPQLKKLNTVRYRLISINVTDYLIKLKQLLLANEKEKSFDQIIDEMQKYKQTTMPILMNKKNRKGNNEHLSKKKKLNDSNQVEIFIQYNDSASCNVISKNENVSKTDASIHPQLPTIKIENTNDEYESNFSQFAWNTTDDSEKKESILDSSDSLTHLNSFSISSPLPTFSLHRLNRTQSFTNNPEKTKNISPRSSSLPSIKFDIKDKIMLTPRLTTPHSQYDSYPTIIDVQENVAVHNQNLYNSQQPLSYYSNTAATTATYSNLYQSPTLHTLSHHELYKNDSSYQSNSYLSSSPVMSNTRKPSHYYLPTSNQPMSSIPCQLSCCIKPKKKLVVLNQRMIYPQHPTMNPPKIVNSTKLSSSIHRKQRRIQSAPYPPTKIYFHPSYKQYLETNTKSDAYHLTPPAVVQNSSTLISPPNTPNDLTLPNICTKSIDIKQAIALHGQNNMDEIPKLVIRHSKTYASKTIDTMGQLFPSWFAEPDYRCIHCFNCDHVFTPQQFMLHVDDEKLSKEQLLNMTSIQLLTSEKMSESKVGLWNQFCTNLTVYASKHAEEEKQKKLSKGRSNNRIRSKQKILDKNKATEVPTLKTKKI